MSNDSKTGATPFTFPREPLARRIFIILLCLYACVGIALAVVVVAPTVHELRRERAEYRAILSGTAREQELGAEVREVRDRLSMMRSDLVGHVPRVLDDRVIHSTLRDAIAKAGMEMTAFESLKKVGEYSLTVKGTFANAVMFASNGLTKQDWLRVEGFTARGIENPAYWIEIHFSLKTAPYAHPPSDRCRDN